MITFLKKSVPNSTIYKVQNVNTEGKYSFKSIEFNASSDDKNYIRLATWKVSSRVLDCKKFQAKHISTFTLCVCVWANQLDVFRLGIKVDQGLPCICHCIPRLSGKPLQECLMTPKHSLPNVH